MKDYILKLFKLIKIKKHYEEIDSGLIFLKTQPQNAANISIFKIVKLIVKLIVKWTINNMTDGLQ